MKLLEHRMVSNYERLAPLYICSIGCHIFNIVNKEIKVLNEGALTADSRLHVIMVTVPGFGKSFMLKQFLNEEVGIISGTRMKPRFLGSMTTAAFIGSIKSDNEGNPILKEGICSKYDKSVIGIHEFAELSNSMKQTYNVGLIDALLSALDDGKVFKDVVGGEIKYETMFTMFSAVQPARYDLSSGLGRRMLFLVYVPSVGDVKKLREVRRKSRLVRDNEELLLSIRKKIDELYDKVKGIKCIRFSTGFYDWMDRNNIIPYEEILYEKIGIGYCIMNGGIKNGELFVDLTDELVEIYERQAMDRKSIKSGIESDQIWRVIKDGDVFKKEELMTILFEFSLSRQNIESQLKTLKVMGWIEIDGDYIKVVKK